MCSYREYQPPVRLTSHIDCFWYFRRHPSSPILGTKPIIPDGCIDIIVDLDHPKRPVLLIGAMTRPITCRRNHLFGIRFRPGAIAALLRSPVHALTDTILPLQEFTTLLPPALWQQIQEDQTGGLELLCTWLAKLLSQAVPAKAELAQALTLLTNSRGRIRLEQVCQEIGWSRQHLSRTFRHHVGVAPKFFAQVQRAHYLLLLAKTAANPDWADLALQCGYYDQAHMLGDFKRLTGLLPRTFLTLD